MDPEEVEEQHQPEVELVPGLIQDHDHPQEHGVLLYDAEEQVGAEEVQEVAPSSQKDLLLLWRGVSRTKRDVRLLAPASPWSPYLVCTAKSLTRCHPPYLPKTASGWTFLLGPLPLRYGVSLDVWPDRVRTRSRRRGVGSPQGHEPTWTDVSGSVVGLCDRCRLPWKSRSTKEVHTGRTLALVDWAERPTVFLVAKESDTGVGPSGQRVQTIGTRSGCTRASRRGPPVEGVTHGTTTPVL